MRYWSLRLKLTLSAAAVFGIVMCLFGIGVARHLYRERIYSLDGDLRQESHQFFKILQKRSNAVDWKYVHGVEDIFRKATTLFLVEIETSDGQLLYRSINSGGFRFEGMARTMGMHTTRFGSKHYRVGMFADNGIVLRLASNLDEVDEIGEDLLLAYLTAGPIVLALAAAGGWWMSNQALSPVAALTEAADRISAEHLDQRLPIPVAQDEIAKLAQVLNRMIDRLERSFEQATRFTADASHQLKTPLTIIRGELEMALRSADCPPGQVPLLLGLLEETGRLSRITESLLLLSRADAGKLRLARDPVAISELMDETLDDAEVLAAERSITLTRAVQSGLTLSGDTQFLRQVLLNLVDNAIKYNNPNGKIHAGLSYCPTEGERFPYEIIFENTGPEISPEDAPWIFKRFHRGRNDATSTPVGGHGLGLSICREIVRACGGKIELRHCRPGWTTFAVCLPG